MFIVYQDCGAEIIRRIGEVCRFGVSLEREERERKILLKMEEGLQRPEGAGSDHQDTGADCSTTLSRSPSYPQ